MNVLSQVISDSGQVRQEWTQRSLEAEVEALERLAAMRGDIAGSVKLEGQGDSKLSKDSSAFACRNLSKRLV